MLFEKLNDCYLDHVALAVTDLDKAQGIYEALGLVFNQHREEVKSEKVITAFASIDEHAHLELLKSTDDDGPIAKFIQKKGEGIHHLCFRVSDIVGKQQELSEQGFKFVYQAPVKGANNCLVNFIHPKSANGVLIELSQKLGGN